MSLAIYPRIQLRGILIGLLLSDAWLSFSNRAAKNAILGFEQSTKYPGFFMLVFSKLSHFCKAHFVHKSRVRIYVRHFSIFLWTRSLPCFTELFTMFYS